MERKKAYAVCGAELIGFARSNARFARRLHKLPQRWRLYAELAGSSLLNLSEIAPGTWAATQLEEKIEKDLKIGRLPARPRKKDRSSLSK